MEIDKKKINVIAFYLPQYHEIPENNEAYGKGFTEWTNVKKAVPLFEGHRQPRVPLNKDYYCLLDGGKTMEKQAKLAKEYGIAGFCYYHYHFKGGKLLLEKPLEMMLQNKKIDIPFCLCWANENWSKRWDGGNNEIIVEQDYDDLASITEHVKYLAPFLKDERYITIDKKPLLIIYKPDLIPNLKLYVETIRECFRKEGVGEIYLASQYPTYFWNHKKLNLFDWYIEFEPMFSDFRQRYEGHRFKQWVKKVLIKLHLFNAIKNPNKNKELARKDYDVQWKANLTYKVKDKRLIAGAFVDWDNTPRVKTGTLYEGATVEKFDSYFGELVTKVNNEYTLPMIFVNAWNEWGEGAYLEPDEENKTGYLEAIKKHLG